MIVLVCGGRDFSDRILLFGTMDRVLSKHPGMWLLHGAAPGADSLAEEWAKDRQIPYIGVPARWDAMGRKAGPIRNRIMRDVWKPYACVAFPGAVGTRGMIDLMKEVGVEPWLVGWELND